MSDRLRVEDPSTNQQANARMHNHARSLAGAGGTIDRRVRPRALQRSLARARAPSVPVRVRGDDQSLGPTASVRFDDLRPTGRRVRARLARFNAPWQSAPVREVLEPLIAQQQSIELREAHARAEEASAAKSAVR